MAVTVRDCRALYPRTSAGTGQRVLVTVLLLSHHVFVSACQTSLPSTSSLNTSEPSDSVCWQWSLTRSKCPHWPNLYLLPLGSTTVVKVPTCHNVDSTLQKTILGPWWGDVTIHLCIGITHPMMPPTQLLMNKWYKWQKSLLVPENLSREPSVCHCRCSGTCTLALGRVPCYPEP